VQLVQRLDQLSPALVVLQASGGYERRWTGELGAAQVRVVMVNRARLGISRERWAGSSRMRKIPHEREFLCFHESRRRDFRD